MVLQPPPEPVTPVIVKVVPAPTPELGVVDVLVQALGLTGLLLLGSFLLGAILGAIFIWYRRRQVQSADTGVRNRYGLDLSSPR